mgnify:CR=1 FL=1
MRSTAARGARCRPQHIALLIPMRRYGVTEVIGEEDMYPTLPTAVAAYRGWAARRGGAGVAVAHPVALDPDAGDVVGFRWIEFQLPRRDVLVHVLDLLLLWIVDLEDHVGAIQRHVVRNAPRLHHLRHALDAPVVLGPHVHVHLEAGIDAQLLPDVVGAQIGIRHLLVRHRLAGGSGVVGDPLQLVPGLAPVVRLDVADIHGLERKKFIKSCMQAPAGTTPAAAAAAPATAKDAAKPAATPAAAAETLLDRNCQTAHRTGRPATIIGQARGVIRA